MRRLGALTVVIVTFTVTFMLVSIGLDVLCKQLHYYDEGLIESAGVYN